MEIIYEYLCIYNLYLTFVFYTWCIHIAYMYTTPETWIPRKSVENPPSFWLTKSWKMDKLSWQFAVCLADKSLGQSQFHWERWPYSKQRCYALQAVLRLIYNPCHSNSKHLSIFEKSRKKGDVASMGFNIPFVSKENTCRSNICSLNHTWQEACVKVHVLPVS